MSDYDELVNRLSDTVYSFCRWLRGRVDEFRKARKYRLANTVEWVANDLSDTFRPLHHYLTEESNASLLLRSYGLFYGACVLALHRAGDIDEDRVPAFFTEATELALSLTLVRLKEVLCGDKV